MKFNEDLSDDEVVSSPPSPTRGAKTKTRVGQTALAHETEEASGNSQAEPAVSGQVVTGEEESDDAGGTHVSVKDITVDLALVEISGHGDVDSSVRDEGTSRGDALDKKIEAAPESQVLDLSTRPR